MTEKSLFVIATSHSVPLEDGTGYVDRNLARLVPNTLYYRRRIQSDELSVVTEDDSNESPLDAQNQDTQPTTSRPSRSRQTSAPQADQTSNPSEDAA